jgi:hypothetical protein
MALEVTLVVLGIVGTAGGFASLVWAIGKVKGLELTVGLLKTGNDALRSELADNDRRHAEELARLEAERRHSEAAAAERIARLEGHNAALVDGVAQQLAAAIGDRLEAVLLGLIAELRPPSSTGGRTR